MRTLLSKTNFNSVSFVSQNNMVVFLLPQLGAWQHQCWKEKHLGSVLYYCLRLIVQKLYSPLC